MVNQKEDFLVGSGWPDYLKPPEGRPPRLGAERPFRELGIPQDSPAGRQELLANAHNHATENRPAETWRETTEEKARRLLKEELDKPGWREFKLAVRAKGVAPQSADCGTVAGGDGGDVAMECQRVTHGRLDACGEPVAQSERKR